MQPLQEQALQELNIALLRHTLNCADHETNQTHEWAKLISRQYENAMLLNLPITCECGTLLCKESSDALNSTLLVLERTGNINTKIYDIIERAISCGILERLLAQ